MVDPPPGTTPAVAAAPLARLAAREQDIAAALSGVGMGWYERDTVAGTVVGSATCAEIFGLPPGDGRWRFEEFTALILPEDLPAYLEEVDRPSPSGGALSRSVRYRICRPDGAVRHIEVRFGDASAAAGRYRYGLVTDITEAVLAERRRDDERISFELAMDSVDMVLWEFDLLTERFRSSPNFSALCGLTPGRQDWSVAEFFARVPPEDHALVRAALERAIHDDLEYAPKHRIIGANGAQRWVQSKARLQRDADGRRARLVGVSWDVSERRMTEERLFGIAQLVPGMLYQFRRSPEGELSFLYVSEGIRDLCGVTPEEACRDVHSMLNRTHADDRQHLMQSMELSAATLTQWHTVLRIFDANGAVRWVEGRANPRRELDGAVLWHGHIFDVTARMASEQELRVTKSRLTLALSAAHMITWQWDTATDVITSGQSLSEFLDCDDEVFTMSSVIARMQADDALSVRRYVDTEARVRGAGIQVLDFRILGKNGTLRAMETRARAEFDRDGVFRGLQGVTIDVSGQRISEQEKIELQDQLQQAQKMELIGLTTGGIAHDFNNILASIAGFAGLAARLCDPATGAKQASFIEEIRLAAVRGADLVQQMLAFSRGEAAQVSPQSLAELLTLAVNMIRPTFPSSIALRTALPPGLPPVATNPVQIQQILMNLCINARDAMNGAGLIEIALAASDAPGGCCASCAAMIGGPRVVLSVRDDGTGIPDHVLARIFEPLFSTKTPDRGTGMGLAMVHNIVHRAGGHITLSTVMGQGTQFDIHFPTCAQLAPAQPKAPLPSPVMQDIASARILVVDDEPAVAGFIAEVLEIAGHSVHRETNAVRALETFRAAPQAFDLVLSDQTMPGLSGAELASTILTLRPELPVILLTGHSATLTTDVARSLGVQALLDKPIDIAVLEAAVARALRAS